MSTRVESLSPILYWCNNDVFINPAHPAGMLLKGRITTSLL